MILIYGAEFTHAYAALKDGKITPNENAHTQVIQASLG